MTVTSKPKQLPVPLHEPTRSCISLSEDAASPLLGKQIMLSFLGVDGREDHVRASVKQIFKKCQEKLSKELKRSI